jgi:hypothetical protein
MDVSFSAGPDELKTKRCPRPAPLPLSRSIKDTHSRRLVCLSQIPFRLENSRPSLASWKTMTFSRSPSFSRIKLSLCKTRDTGRSSP